MRGVSAASGPAETAVRRADALAVALGAALVRITVPLARAAGAFVRLRGWTDFGFARLDDHARERFGRSGHWVRDLAALDEPLASLPALATALTGEDGGAPLGRVRARLLAGVAAAESADAWIAFARRASVRDLRAAVRAQRDRGSLWPPGVEADAAREARTAAPQDSGLRDDVLGASRRRDDGPFAAGSRDDSSRAANPTGDVDDPDQRCLVRLLVPATVAAAFEDALDLYRALVGSEATVDSFVDSLVGEALAGPHPPDLEAVPLRSGPRDADVESALARSTGNWADLPGSVQAAWAQALAGLSLLELEELSRRAGTGGPADLNSQLEDLLRLENRLERRLGALLAQMADQRAWSRLRFGGVAHYAEQRLGLSRSATHARVRAARALRRLPILRRAYEQGDIGLTAVLHVVRILQGRPADVDVQQVWVRRAGEATLKRLKDEERTLGRREAEALAGRLAGTPTSHSGGDPEEVVPPAGPLPLDDDTWHGALRRAPGDSRGRLARFGAAAASSGGPDVFLRLRLSESTAACFLAAIESARARLADTADREGPSPDRDPPGSLAAARRFSVRRRRSPAWVGLLALLEDFVDTWDVPGSAPRRPGDDVRIRDGWRCSAPGCTARRNLHLHHVRHRARGGGHASWNLVLVCEFHHLRGEHGALARCRGTAPLGIVWRLGRAEIGRWYRNERRLEAGADA